MDISGPRPVNRNFSRPLERRPAMQPQPQTQIQQQQPFQPQPQPVAYQATTLQQPKEGKVKKIALVAIVSLVLLGFGAATGYFYWQNTQAQKELADARNALVDKTGLINVLKQRSEGANKPVAAVKPAVAKSDEELVAIASKAYAEVRVLQGAQLAPKIDKLEAGFAAVSLPHPSGAIRLVLKKAPNGEWVALKSSVQGKFTADEANIYKVPQQFKQYL